MVRQIQKKKGKKEEENEANIAKFLFKQNLYVMTLIYFLTYCFIDSLGIYLHLCSPN